MNFRPDPKPVKRAKKSRRERQGKVDTPHVAKVKMLPCVICDNYGFTQTHKTDAHHCFDGRGSQDKEHDRETIPLCLGHHQGDGTDKIAIHLRPKLWRELYGIDYDYVSTTLDRIEELE